MAFILLFALSLVGAGYFFGQNPYAPEAPVMIEKNNPELGYSDSSEPSRNPVAVDPSALYYYKGVHLTPRLGFETALYNQTGISSFSQTAVRANLDLIYFFDSSPWVAQIQSNFTALPLTSNRSGVTAHFFEANADLGYSLIQTGILNFRIFGGFSYNTIQSTNQVFGYPGLYFPELYPSLTLHLLGRVTLEASYHYVFLGSLFDTSQVQIVRSLGVSVFLSPKHSISARVEDNGFSLLLNPTTQLQNYSVGVTVGYSF